MLMYRKQHRNKNNTLRQAELRVRGLDKAAGMRLVSWPLATLCFVACYYNCL